MSMSALASNSVNSNGQTVKRRVAYFYDPEIGNYHYGQGHPMKPHRVRMTHNLVVNYGLYRKMDVFRPKLVSAAQLSRFHSDDYVNFLRLITPDNMRDYVRQLQRFNVGEDCPVFDGLFVFDDYLQLLYSFEAALEFTFSNFSYLYSSYYNLY